VCVFGDPTKDGGVDMCVFVLAKTFNFDGVGFGDEEESPMPHAYAPVTFTHLAFPLIVPGTRTVIVGGVQLGRILRGVAVGSLSRIVPR